VIEVQGKLELKCECDYKPIDYINESYKLGDNMLYVYTDQYRWIIY